MANPVTIGTTAIIAVPRRENRDQVRFQNTGNTTLYFIRQVEGQLSIPSSTNFEFAIYPAITTPPTATELNEAHESVVSTAQFNVVSSASGGSLAIFETLKV